MFRRASSLILRGERLLRACHISSRVGWDLARVLMATNLCAPALAVASTQGMIEFPMPPPDQAAQYRAEVPKSILELQQFRASETATMKAPDGGTRTITLTNLNPSVNAWFVLTLTGASRSYHLENPDRQGRNVRLAQTEPWGLVLTDRSGTYSCDLWRGSPSPLDEAVASHAAYAPVCDGRLYLRNPVVGHRTKLERVAEFLRDKVWCGEALVGFVREELFQDAFRENGALGPCSISGDVDGPEAPKGAALDASAVNIAAKPQSLGIKVDHVSPDGLLLGRWYPATELSGAYVSLIQPSTIAPTVLDSSRQFVNRLDSTEAAALDYLVAFDLSQFDLGFSLGTDHPRLGWSPRPPATARRDALPGPDGVAGAAPLVTTGMLNPTVREHAIATFTGGFKREHGAFRYGPLATENHGSHYGFIEAGVVFSKLRPGLATLYVLDDGSVHMTTWTPADDRMLGRVMFARQNGVALVEPDPVTGVPGPGRFVNKWGPGNWSGSADESLRTLRSGACLQERESKRFLVYAFFSTATPSAMARVFQAYGCRYAMLLDMNALEHTYLALYVHEDKKVTVEHLVAGMAQVDKTVDGQMIPRFVGFPDNRDFFYLTRRDDRR